MTTLRQAEQEAAQAFHDHEMATDTASDRAYARFLDNVSALTGIADLDGDNSAKAKAAGTADGYSLDDCLDWFDAGWTPEQAAAEIVAALA